MAGFGMKDYQVAMKVLQSVSRIIKHKEFERLLQTETERPTILAAETTGAGGGVDDCGDCEFGQADIEHTEESLLAVGDHCAKARTSCVTEEANTHGLTDICPTVPEPRTTVPESSPTVPEAGPIVPNLRMIMPEQAASASKPTAPETSACIPDPSEPEPPTTAVPIVPEHSISALSK
ncbi:hypothetical protein DVH05_008640 [Phytophthora capsici]|nr:hypothetical protein DVH05_008640 [Phytophthora capsici]